MEVSFGEAVNEGQHVFTGFVRDITSRKRNEEDLRRLSGYLLRLQDEERRKIANDLHDSTGQVLVALATNLGFLHAAIPSSQRKSRTLVTQCLELADQCIREVRTFSYLLYPPMLHEGGLADAIRHYADGFTRQSRIQLVLEVSPNFGRLREDVELALFRVVQESLTNIHRHSGSDLAKIVLHRSPQGVLVEVRDFGRGTSGSRPGACGEIPFEVGVGISSMKDRVTLVGGHLEIESGANGTTVRAKVSGVVEREQSAKL